MQIHTEEDGVTSLIYKVPCVRLDFTSGFQLSLVFRFGGFGVVFF